MKKTMIFCVILFAFTCVYAEEKSTNDYDFVKHWKETTKKKNHYNFNMYYGDIPGNNKNRPPFIVPYPYYGPYPSQYPNGVDQDGNHFNITIFEDGSDENYIYHKDPSKTPEPYQYSE